MSHNSNPAQYGWNYQGSNQASKVEFYEKDGVKMDYYYTTGEVLVRLKALFELCGRGFQQIMHSTLRWKGAAAWLRSLRMEHRASGRHSGKRLSSKWAAVSSSRRTSGSISLW
jgi:hypothetical protein